MFHRFFSSRVPELNNSKSNIIAKRLGLNKPITGSINIVDSHTINLKWMTQKMKRYDIEIEKCCVNDLKTSMKKIKDNSFYHR